FFQGAHENGKQRGIGETGERCKGIVFCPYHLKRVGNDVKEEVPEAGESLLTYYFEHLVWDGAAFQYLSEKIEILFVVHIVAYNADRHLANLVVCVGNQLFEKAIVRLSVEMRGYREIGPFVIRGSLCDKPLYCSEGHG